jgi:hypothetical protein
MPTYSGSTILRNDEWILLQIKEGPCSAGCDYCYENAHIRTVLGAAQATGAIEPVALEQMSTIELTRLTERYREEIGAEMDLDEVSAIFRLLKASGIGRAGLIGSEPSTHRHFTTILDFALESCLELLVYTAGLALRKMQHPAIKFIVLHLDYGRLDAEDTARRLDSGSLPSPAYMSQICSLLSQGKEIHLRLNFSSPTLGEAKVAHNFFSQVPAELRARTRLKYSFNTRVSGDSSVTYETPESLRRSSKLLLEFIDGFVSKYPEAALLSERPLFPCAFDEATWHTYSERGGFLASCDMEYTFYPSKGLALCPPSRNLVHPKSVSTSKELQARLLSLRGFLDTTYRVPSFDCCEPCALRQDLTCQGGCLGYKVGRGDGASLTTVMPFVPLSALRA